MGVPERTAGKEFVYSKSMSWRNKVSLYKSSHRKEFYRLNSLTEGQGLHQLSRPLLRSNAGAQATQTLPPASSPEGLHVLCPFFSLFLSPASSLLEGQSNGQTLAKSRRDCGRRRRRERQGAKHLGGEPDLESLTVPVGAP